ncbi:MAG: sulfatase-like hydrolase/transferase, partial [Victivallales bacterium]
MTGQYLHTHGIQGNRVVQYPVRNSDTLPALFRRSGYRTAQLGKAHVPRNWLEEGYEHIRLVDLADAWPNDPRTCHYFKWLEENGVAGCYEDGTGRPGCIGGLTGIAPADLPYKFSNEAYTGNETLAYLEGARNDERPFFVKMSFERPHAPMRPAREYFDLYDPEHIELPASSVDYFERRFAGKPQWMVEKLRNGCDYPMADPDPKALKKVLAAYYALITCIDMEIGRAI